MVLCCACALQMLGSSAGARETETSGGGRAAIADVRGPLYVPVQRAEEAERNAGVCLQTSWCAVVEAACGSTFNACSKLTLHGVQYSSVLDTIVAYNVAVSTAGVQ